jgi:hypothetical protein
MMAWAITATLIALAALGVLVWREWPRTIRPFVPLLGTRLQTVQAFRAFNTPEGRLVLLHLGHEFVFREQHVPNDPHATAYRCGEAALALRMIGLASPRIRQQIMETLIQQEVRHG